MQRASGWSNGPYYGDQASRWWMSSGALEVSYSQVLLFDAHLEHCFNDWTDAHVAQGFSWRPGSVSFKTLESAGLLHVEVLHAQAARDSASPTRRRPERCIVVPFQVPTHKQCEVATVDHSMPVELEPGEYKLTFEHGRLPNGDMWAVFRLEPASSPVQARIVIADSDLSPPDALLMTASPAY